MNKTIIVSLDALGRNILADRRISAPWIRKIMQEGSCVGNLETVFPSVTWAIHSTVVTGKHPSGHGILGNRVLDRNTGEVIQYHNPHKSLKKDLYRAPSITDMLAKRGLVCDAVCWPLSQGDDSIRHNIPEFYVQDHFNSYSSPEIWQELREKGFPVQHYAEWSAKHALGPLQDSLTCDICKYLIRSDMPDLLLTHFLLIDSFLHDFGPGSAESIWAIEYVDKLVGELLLQVEGANPEDSTNIILFSDHGHAAVDFEIETGKILEESGFENWTAVSNGGSVFLYRKNSQGQYAANHDAANPDRITRSEKKGLALVFEETGWIQRFLWPEDYSSIHFPVQDSQNPHLPDAIIEFKTGFIGGENKNALQYKHVSRYKGMHGYAGNNPEMAGFLAAYGPDFTTGKYREKASMTDIAPTLAQLWDIENFPTDGNSLSDFLEISRKKIAPIQSATIVS